MSKLRALLENAHPHHHPNFSKHKPSKTRGYVRAMARVVKILEDRKAVSARDTQRAANALKVDWAKEEFTLAQLRAGMLVELEHQDVTGGDLVKTAKIALAHLRERPDYYEKLRKMEDE